MILKAQLSGQFKTGKKTSLFQVKEKLEQYGVRIAHPSNDGFIFTQNAGAPGLVSALWTPYESNLDYYETTAASDAYIVNNEDGIITDWMARGILYAMLQHKAILLLHKPAFDQTVGIFVREVLLAHVDQFLIFDILTTDKATVLEQLQGTAQSVDYDLNARDITIIKAIIRKHFRELLARGKPHQAQHATLAT